MFWEYLKDCFVRTWLGERLQDFWHDVKFYAPLLDGEQRSVIWPQFKELLEKEKKMGILYRTILLFIAGIVCLICAPFCVPFFRFLCIITGIFGIVVYPLWTMWTFRKIFHGTDRGIEKAIIDKLRAIEKAEKDREEINNKTQSAQSTKPAEPAKPATAPESKNSPTVAAPKSRRKPLHP